ncbi:MAG: quinone-dependent dihydroorotate dehydrogenase [Patescibacteria group bacterium]|nr:quinone-dependent dihydroorotate dehydrogenase [Patescibacteria group bacterium]
MIYEKILKPVFFAFDAEDMHRLFTWVGENLGRTSLTRWATAVACRPVHDPILATELAGVKLEHPLGVAAGFDKEGRMVPILKEVGFSFVEVGSITGRPSPGNQRPRLWRLPEDRALVINFGLLSSGAEAAANRFKAYRDRGRWPMPVGISVAKANVPGLGGESGLEDLLEAFQKLEPFSDYMTVNVSCPNTADGVQYCKDPAMYRECLSRLDDLHLTKPVFFKISPDLTEQRLIELMADTDRYAWAKGFIMTNLTHDRSGLTSKNLAIAKSGGVSGPHLKTVADQSLKTAYKNSRGRYQFIGVGGIDSVDDAYRKIRLGASALQLVTSLIYNGPLWPSQLMRSLAKRLRQDGFKSLKEAVGVDNQA